MRRFIFLAAFLIGVSWIAGAVDEVTLIAQATCSSLPVRAGWVYAVMRHCSSNSTTACADICESPALKSQDQQLVNHAIRGLCLESIHVYGNRPALTLPRTLGPKVFRYHSCYSSACGPNYCCCWFR